MKTLSRRDFEKRWNNAKTAAQKTVSLKAAAPQITLSIETILDGYEAQLKKAAQAHAIDTQTCSEICAKISNLKAVTQPVKDQLAPFMKI